MSNLPIFTPAPIRMRKDGWTPARQWEFLQVLGDTASVGEAASKVGMSEASAHRLRRHPEAEDFRVAWDATVRRNWERVEASALERVVNGEVEIIERGGEVVATRRRPCSDRLMIHMLQQQLRRLELDAAARAAEQAAEAARARGQRLKWATGTAAQATLAGLADAMLAADPMVAAEKMVAAETGKLRTEQARMARLPDRSGWVLHADALDGAVPLLPMPERVLAPADGRIEVRGRGPGMRDPAVVAARAAARAAKAAALAAAAEVAAEARMAAEVEAWMVRNGASGADLPYDAYGWRTGHERDGPPRRAPAAVAVRSL